MKKLLFSVIILLAVSHRSVAQMLLMNPDWVKLTSVGFNDANHVSGVVADKEGNVYTLIDASGAIIYGVNVGLDNVNAALIKQNRAGEKLWVKYFGARNLAGGVIGLANTLTIDNAGDLVIGGAYNDSFFYDNVLVSMPDSFNKETFWANGYMLKADRDGNLKWFKELNCSSFATPQELVTDNQNNIYTAITFYGNLDLDNEVVNTTAQGNVCLAKLNSSGKVQWVTRLQTDSGYVVMNNTRNQLAIYYPQPNCPPQLLFTANVVGKSLYVNGEYRGNVRKKPYVTLEFDSDGQYAQHLQANGSIVGLAPAKDKIYMMGIFNDSLETDKVLLTGVGNNVYLAELDENLLIKNAKTVISGDFQTVTGFKYSPVIGLLLSGASYEGLMNTKLGTFPTEPRKRNAFVMNFDAALEPREISWIKGDAVTIEYLCSWNEYILGGVYFRGLCMFENDLFGATANNVVVFSDRPFKNVQWPSTNTKPEALKATPYPTPFHDDCYVKFEKPIYGYTYNVYNNMGQLCEKATVSVVNSTSIKVEMNKMSAGVYYLRMRNCCDQAIEVKLVKN